MQNCVATRRGILALLTFWRAWSHAIPAVGRITDADLDKLDPAQFWYRPSYYVPELGRHILGPAYDPTPDIEALYRRRALWDRIRAILDLPDDEAVETLDALVNGSHDEDLLPFYGLLSHDLPYPDQLYEDYLQHFYVPFQRHVYPRLKPPLSEAVDAVPDWALQALEAMRLSVAQSKDDDWQSPGEAVAGPRP